MKPVPGPDRVRARLFGIMLCERDRRGAPRPDRSFDVTVGTELLKVRPQIVGFLVVLDAGKGHLGAGYLGLRGLDVILETLFIPNDSRILVGVTVIKSCNRTGLAAVEPVLRWADLVLRALADRMARQTLFEGLLTGRHIRRQRTAGGGGKHRSNQYQRPCHGLLLSAWKLG